MLDLGRVRRIGAGQRPPPSLAREMMAAGIGSFPRHIHKDGSERGDHLCMQELKILGVLFDGDRCPKLIEVVTYMLAEADYVGGTWSLVT